jgi:hypothetical protein
MDSQVELERRYRRLLRVYPRRYQRERADEMVATLMEGAGPDQRRPARGEVTDLLRGALRERLGLHAVPGLAAGLRLAGPVGVVIAAVVAAAYWWYGLRDPESTVVTVAWLGAAGMLVAWPRRLAWAVTVAWVATVGSAVVAYFAAGPPEISANPSVYAPELFGGLVAVLAVAAGTWRPSLVERFATGLAVAAAVAVTVVRDTPGPDAVNFGLPAVTPALRAIPLVLMVVGVGWAVLRRRSGPLWAALFAALAVPFTLPWDDRLLDWFQLRLVDVPQLRAVTVVFGSVSKGPVSMQSISTFQTWSRAGFVKPNAVSWSWGGADLAGLAAAGIMLALLAVAVAVSVAHHRAPTPRDGRAALATLGSLALGVAAGLSLWTAADLARGSDLRLSMLALAVPVLAAVVANRWFVLASAAATYLFIHNGQPDTDVDQLLGFVLPLLVLGAAPERRRRPVVGVAALGAAALSTWVLWWQGTLSLWVSMTGVAATAAIPLVLALGWGPVVALRAHRGLLAGGLAFAAGLWWVGTQIGSGELTLVIAGTVLLVVTRFAVVRLGPRLRPRPAGQR